MTTRRFLLCLLLAWHRAILLPSIHALAETAENATTTTTATSSSAEDCTPESFLGGKLSTCRTYQIATLNSSPRRCLHIEAPDNNIVPASASSDNSIDNSIDNNNNNNNAPNTVCQNIPNFHDGTNGCKEYADPRNSNFCAEYGHLDYTPYSPHTPNQACCACGGGTHIVPRLRVGDSVKIVGSLLANKNDPNNKHKNNNRNNNMPNSNNNNNNNPFESCKDLTIIDIRTSPSFAYIVQVGKTPCGMQQFVVEQGMGKRIHQYPSGMQFMVEVDEESVIERHYRVELRKCRGGKVEQEFRLEVLPQGKQEGMNGNGDTNEKKENAEVRIIHSPTGLNLASILGAKMPILELQQVFEHGLFEGSGDYVFVRSIEGKKDNGNDDAFRHFQQQQQQQGEGNKASLLASGNFGEKEYSEVEFFPTKRSVGFEEQTFSMWMFKEVEEMREENNESGGTTTSGAAPARPMDEHAEWLERMTHLIGIDYLEELAPWHLLDVERESSKTDVKARFRELSRYFHPDKVSPEKKYVFEKIFVLLQDAYGGLKTADEAEKESFRSKADFDSQLFAHSKYVIELLPFHWTKLTSSSTKGNDGLDGEEEADSTSNNDDTYVLNAASHLNSALFQNVTDPNEEESEPSVQLWVVFKYSSRCSMSRTVEGFIDLAARHLEQYENIKVGAYGCGLYKDFKATKKDVLGLTADPICKQFHRSETPNVHVIVETLPGRKRDENGMMVEVPPDPKLLEENSKFKYFYSGVPDGNVTAFYPHHFIQFAKAGKRIWNNSHLVKKMIWEDFNDASFAENVTIVAFMDGTGEGDTNQEVVDAISNSLPGLARRFLEDGLQVGVASCGYGDEYKNDDDVSDAVDCSKLDVSWLPDVKIYRENDTQGFSLLRGQFGDRRDVQIALESMGNVLRMMLGGEDGYDDEDFEELKENEDDGADGSCQNEQQQPPPPQGDFDLNLDEIDGNMEEPMMLDTDSEKEIDDPKPPSLDQDSKPQLEEKPRKPKLASGESRLQLDGGHRSSAKDQISGFAPRSEKRRGGGKVLGGGGGGSAGAIAG